MTDSVALAIRSGAPTRPDHQDRSGPRRRDERRRPATGSRRGRKPARNRFGPPTEPIPCRILGCHGEVTDEGQPEAAVAGSTRSTTAGRRSRRDRSARRAGRCAPGPARGRGGRAAGCGAPEYTYVTNSEDRTYLRDPALLAADRRARAGEAIGLDPTDDAAQTGFWLEGYDADATPVGRPPAGPALGRARPCSSACRTCPSWPRGQISLDLLRDLFRPVSASAPGAGRR